MPIFLKALAIWFARKLLRKNIADARKLTKTTETKVDDAIVDVIEGAAGLDKPDSAA